jgi:hypothetical protein
MARTSHQQSNLLDTFSRLFAANPALLISVAFEAGKALGRYTNVSPRTKKVLDGIADLADQVVELAPNTMTNLVPELFPAKARTRRKTTRKKAAPTATDGQ